MMDLLEEPGQLAGLDVQREFPAREPLLTGPALLASVRDRVSVRDVGETERGVDGDLRPHRRSTVVGERVRPRAVPGIARFVRNQLEPPEDLPGLGVQSEDLTRKTGVAAARGSEDHPVKILGRLTHPDPLIRRCDLRRPDALTRAGIQSNNTPELLLGVDLAIAHRETPRRSPRARNLERALVLRRDDQLLAVRLVGPELLPGRRIERKDSAVLVLREGRPVVLELRCLAGELE